MTLTTPNALRLAAAVLVVGTASYFGFRLEAAGQPAFWVIVALPTLGLAAFAAFEAYRDGELGAWLLPRAGDPTKAVLGTAVLFLLAYGFSVVVTPSGSPRESWMARLYLQFGHPAWLREHAIALLAGLVVLAAAEEVVWRGWVSGAVAETVGSRRAWIFAALLYAVAHAPTAWALRDPLAGPNPVIALGALGAGLFWGGMARVFGRLVPSILCHALFDWIVLVVFRLWGRGF
jgi:membrane protease YdiL (CAAX protease family)